MWCWQVVAQVCLTSIAISLNVIFRADCGRAAWMGEIQSTSCWPSGGGKLNQCRIVAAAPTATFSRAGLIRCDGVMEECLAIKPTLILPVGRGCRGFAFASL